MPTILRKGSYRFYFYSHEPNEPPHIHVDSQNLSAKFWLKPIGLVRNIGFNAHELRILRDIITENQEMFLEVWNGYFGIVSG